MEKFLGNFSPAYGIMTGEGEMGRASRKGLFGMLPRMITKDAQEEEAAQLEAAQLEAAQLEAAQAGRPAAAASAGRGSGMKKGGSVSASKRADGCAKKGKTKGRMV
jgi:hypothetical protein